MDLPQSLKEVLLGAHEQIHEQNVLPELPSRPCVNDILNLYVEQKRALQDNDDVHVEVRLTSDNCNPLASPSPSLSLSPSPFLPPPSMISKWLAIDNGLALMSHDPTFDQ